MLFRHSAFSISIRTERFFVSNKYFFLPVFFRSSSKAKRKLDLPVPYEPIIVNGHEDYAKSRRVELKIKVKDWSVASAFGLKK